MRNIEEITKEIISFRDERDWKKFHKPKDLAVSLSLEVAEVLEHFQWKNDEEIEKYIETNKEEIGEELADVLNYLLIMAHDFGIDLMEAEEKKIAKNRAKYPVEKSKGVHTKYDKL